MQDVLDFLSELKRNNNKEWFDQNREWYQACRDKMVFLTGLMIQEASRFDDEIANQDPRNCIFRIYRDVRFSPDKTPYKTHIGTYISRGGRKSIHAGYYLHIEPGGSFVSGGCWAPPANALKAIRTEIYDHSEAFKKLISDDQFSLIFPEMYDDKLKTAPKGFPKDFAHIDLLKYKSYAFISPLTDRVVTGDKFVEKIITAMKHIYPVNRFLNGALEKWMEI